MSLLRFAAIGAVLYLAMAALLREPLPAEQLARPSASVPKESINRQPSGVSVNRFAAFAEPSLAIAATVSPSDERSARNEIVRRSVRAYTGSCACPYNVDRSGNRCGARSAYSKPGGEQPICYPNDVTEAMLRQDR